MSAKLEKLSPVEIIKKKNKLIKVIEKAHRDIQDLKLVCSHENHMKYAYDPSGDERGIYYCTACECESIPCT